MGAARTRSRRQRPPGAALLAAAGLSTLGLFLVVVLGFVDTFTGSALGCGHSFPLCHGSLFPSDNLRTIIEWSHRALAAVVGVVVGVPVIWAWVRAGAAIEVRVLGAVAIGFIFIESVVGALAVLSPESQALIAVHLGIALTAFAATALLLRVLWVLRRGPLRRPPVPPGLARRAWVMLGFMYVAVYVGAYVAGTDSGVACLTWPLCPIGRVTLSLGNPVTIDLIHRLVAAVGGLLALDLFLAARRGRVARPDLARLGHTVLALLVLQIASGWLLVRTHIAIETTVLHVALATVLFTAVAEMALGVLPEAGGAVAGPPGAIGGTGPVTGPGAMDGG